MPAAWYNFVGKCPFPELHSLVIPLVGQDLISLLLELDSLEEGKGILQDMGTNSLGHPGPPAIPPNLPHTLSLMPHVRAWQSQGWLLFKWQDARATAAPAPTLRLPCCPPKCARPAGVCTSGGCSKRLTLGDCPLEVCYFSDQPSPLTS